MIPLTQQAHQFQQTALRPGDLAIDATAGNGHDTLFLAQTVGPSGHVYAFDLQPEALAKTQQRLDSACIEHVTLINASHTRMSAAIPHESHGQIGGIMFNLGYLPGGDKSIRTDTKSTLKAIEQSLSLLRGGGCLTIIAYTGHPGGKEEADDVAQLLHALPSKQYELTEPETNPEMTAPPQLYVVYKRD